MLGLQAQSVSTAADIRSLPAALSELFGASTQRLAVGAWLITYLGTLAVGAWLSTYLVALAVGAWPTGITYFVCIMSLASAAPVGSPPKSALWGSLGYP